MVVCDFNEHKIYLCKISGDELLIISSSSTVTNNGDSVETDLMDVSGDTIVVSNFRQGSVSFYCISNNQIEFIKELNLAVQHKNMHGVRFVPGYENLLWVTFCGFNNKCHQIWDIENNTILHDFKTDEQCQDVGFIENKAVVFARTDHIWTKHKPHIFSSKRKMYVSAYVYALPKNLNQEKPELISEWRGKGHIDAVKEYNGKLYGANQYLNRVDVFSLDSDCKLNLDKTINGFSMPHGLDIHEGLLAVTNYKDQTLKLSKLDF